MRELSTYEIQNDDRLPRILLAVLIDFEVQRIEMDDRRVRVGHEPLIRQRQEVARGRREAAQQLLERIEGLSDFKMNNAGDFCQSLHILQHRSIMIRIVPRPTDTTYNILILFL